MEQHGALIAMDVMDFHSTIWLWYAQKDMQIDIKIRYVTPMETIIINIQRTVKTEMSAL